MKRLLDYVEFQTGETASFVANKLDISKQNYSRMKKTQSKHFKMLVDIKKKFNLTADEIFKCLEHDYK